MGWIKQLCICLFLLGGQSRCQTRPRSWGVTPRFQSNYPQSRHPPRAPESWQRRSLLSSVTHMPGKEFGSPACLSESPLPDICYICCSCVYFTFLHMILFPYRKEPRAIFFTTYVTTQNIHSPLGSAVFVSQSIPSVLEYPISPSTPHHLNLILSM